MKQLQRLLWAPGDSELFANAGFAAKSVAAEWVHERRYKPQHCKISYRVLNDWTEKELVDDDRVADSQGWRSFSLTDLLWIQTLVALRGYGLAHELLKKVKASLEIGNKKAYSTMAAATFLCMKRYPLFIAVFEDGHAELATARGLSFADDVLGPQTYLRINLNQLFRKMIGDDKGKYIPKQTTRIAVEHGEADVLEALREQGVSEVVIRKRREKISMIESTKDYHGPVTLIDHIKDIEYGDVTTKVEAGKQQLTKVVRRRKLD